MARCVEYAPLIKPITVRVLSERYNSTHGLMINTRCMLFTGLGVRIGKNRARGVEYWPKAAGRGRTGDPIWTDQMR